MRTAAAALAAAFVLAAPVVGAAERPDSGRLSLDPFVSLETGSDATRSVTRLLAGLESAACRPLAGRNPAGIGARAARTLLVDLPVAWWLGVLEHEAFGHGGRAREFGSHATFHMGSPWGGRDSYSEFSTEGLGTLDFLRISAGGSESNGWTATQMERDLVAGRTMRSLDLLFLAANRWVTNAYVLRTTPDPETDPAGFWAEWAGGGDVANYLGRLSQEFTGDIGITPAGSSALVRDNYSQLARQARWNLLDPGMWLSLWAAGRAVLDGEEFPRVPLPSFRGRTFLPVLSADWLPDGGVASLELVVRSRDGVDRAPVCWSSLVIRGGAGPAGRFWALGAATEHLVSLGRLRVGGEFETWRRPDRGLGGGFRARLAADGAKLHGFFADIGVKSAGHWPGRPAGTGPFVRIGVSVPLP